MAVMRHLLRPYRWLVIGISVLGILVVFAAWCIAPLRAPRPPTSSTKVVARDGSLLYEVASRDAGNRTFVPLARVPISLVQALVASEDAHFYSHPGVDIGASIRALKDRVLGTGVLSGASTIEQQLIKTTYFPNASRSVLQKIRESIGAIYWARTHTKEQTLEQYLNTIYFGNASYGVEAASQLYFHTSVHDVSVAESAMLVGMVPSPSSYDPYRHWSVARKRQNSVLQRMVDQGFLTPAEREQAFAIDLPIFPSRHPITAPHFVLRVLEQLEETYPEIRNGGYVIKTTLDPALQRVAEETVNRRLASIAQQQVTDASVVAMDPQNGDVLAYVGSADYFDQTIQGQVDMANAKRQPGSALKPFMYLASFMHGKTPSTIVPDLPVRFDASDGRGYYPRNYGYKYHGPVTIRDALGSSLNIPAVVVLNQIGMGAFFDALTRFSIIFPEAPEYYGLGIVLGGGEVSLTDATRAYAELARGSQFVPIRMVTELDDARGNVIQRFVNGPSYPLFTNAHLAEQATALLTNILRDQKARALSFGETSLMDIGNGIAAKTGTTKDFRDNWAFGYAPNFALGVWVGNADNSPMKGVSGVTGAAPIWHDIMQSRFPRPDPIHWSQPDGLVQRRVCVTSGMLANDICPKTRDDWFIEGTEPTKLDDWYVSCAGKTYLDPPSQYADWLRVSGYEQPPDGICSGLKRSTRDALQILSPLDGDVFIREDVITGSDQRIPFVAGGGQPPYQWRLNGKPLLYRDALYLWDPQPGTYTLELVGSNRQVHFSVQ